MKEPAVAKIADRESALRIQDCNDSGRASNRSYLLCGPLKHKRRVEECTRGCLPACTAFNRWWSLIIGILGRLLMVLRLADCCAVFLWHLALYLFCFIFIVTILIELLNLLLAIAHELVWKGLAGKAHIDPAGDAVGDSKASLRNEIGIFIAFFSLTDRVRGRDYGKLRVAWVDMGAVGPGAPLLAAFLVVNFILACDVRHIWT